MNILAIGNSFSQDATHYLHQIAQCDGEDLEVTNLYIGGCSLEKHWHNIEQDAKDYLLEENGESTERFVSIKEALHMKKWDYILTQQASHDSGKEETYEPYLGNMIGYIKELCPEAKLLLQETWAYESDSMHGGFASYDHSQQKMYECLKEQYEAAAKRHGLGVIPCGDVIQILRTKEPFLYGHGGMSICRDGFHMNVLYGRYLLAAVWYRFLTGRSVLTNTYKPYTKLAPNAILDETVLAVVKEVVEANV